MTESATETLAEALRDLRATRRLTQAELAELVGTGASHLSRIESGQREEISRDLLERLGEALRDQGRLARAARRLTAAAEVAVAAYPGALQPEPFRRCTRPALRRLDALHTAESMLNRIPGALGADRVDPAVLCRSYHGPGRRPWELVTARRGVPAGSPVQFDTNPAGHPRVIIGGGLSAGGAAAMVRFLQAHAAAHLDVGALRCELPRASDPEVKLADVACALLAPRGLLEDAVAAAGADAADVWTPEGATVVESVASQLGIPAWVAVRRLADEGLLDLRAMFDAAPGSAA